MTEILKVLHLTTHDEECGIAKYQAQFLKDMGYVGSIENKVFEYSPNQIKNMTDEEFDPVFQDFKKQIKSFDVLHVQHEFSFYKRDELDQIVSFTIKKGKKVIITVHTSPGAVFRDVHLHGFGPRSFIHFLRQKRRENKLDEIHLVPMRKADLLLVHNTVTENHLVKHGVKRSKIIKINMPVPKLSFDMKSTDISMHLNKKAGDIIYCTVGFMSKTKGTLHAVKALAYLPKNYKLAIIGGAHPSGENDNFYDNLCDLIVELNLESRIYITGYIKEDERLNSLIRECDICVYPFNKEYYAGVTSASLNDSIANYKTAIAYPTEPIIEMNKELSAVAVCDSFNYYELARIIRIVDIKKQEEISRLYASEFSYVKEAKKLDEIYRKLIN